MFPVINKILHVLRFGRLNRNLSWQARKDNSHCKAALINNELSNIPASSVLDIGCNAGQVSRLVSSERFVVGIDIDVDILGFSDPLGGVALGKIPLDLDVLSRMPNFDAILLLSVHHQWYKLMGEDVADQLFSSVLNKANKVLFVEFPALNRKYGYQDKFIDNNPESVKDFALDFLVRFVDKEQIKYLGKCKDNIKKEPFRYMFMINVSKN